MSKEFKKANEASGAASSEHSESGSPLNNIDPDKYIIPQSMPDEFLPLRWGIDSLYLSYRGDMTEDARQRLEKLKDYAQTKRQEHLAQVQAAGFTFMVSDKGRGRYRYVLLGSCFEIQLCDTPSPNIPVAYVKVLSRYLTSRDPISAKKELRSILELFCMIDGKEKVSRADLFLDFCYRDTDMLSLSAMQFVTRAGVIRPYYTDQVLTGWDFGLGSELSARLYNKTLQITKSGQSYLKPLWLQGGWNGEETVWRIEFQLRRYVLDRFSVFTVKDLMTRRAELWSYLTLDWLRLTVNDSEDSNRSRRKMHPLWDGVWFGGCGSETIPMQKQVRHNKAPELVDVVQMLCGPLSSLFALRNITNVKDGLHWLSLNLERLLNENYKAPGLRFNQHLASMIKKKIRLFNLRMNDETLNNPGNFYK